ncbi:hypothetical protein BJV82DRAFT_576928 [Fennellomyces sp. T-0311]|nr:hypothetical protein BJV82DRAFT_576928 [Fennellomyces sp. T-0311]
MTHAAAIQLYRRHAQILWNDSSPFPVTAAKLIRFIKDKQCAGVRYNSLRAMICSFNHYPAHRKSWKRKVFLHTDVLAALRLFKEVQGKEDEINPVMTISERRARRNPKVIAPRKKQIRARFIAPPPEKLCDKPTGFVVQDEYSNLPRKFHTTKFRPSRSVAVVIEPLSSILV